MTSNPEARGKDPEARGQDLHLFVDLIGGGGQRLGDCLETVPKFHRCLGVLEMDEFSFFKDKNGELLRSIYFLLKSCFFSQLFWNGTELD